MLNRKASLLALPLALLLSYSSQAQSSGPALPGDILIAGDGDENGSSIAVEAPPGVELEALYGSTLLANNRLSAEKIFAVLIIVPPKNVVVFGGGSGLEWSKPWIFQGTHTMTQQLHPPDDYISKKDHNLEYELDGRKKTLKVGKQTFDLTKGKYFVVALDKTWKPSSTQLKDDLKVAPLPAKTLSALRKLFLKSGNTP